MSRDIEIFPLVGTDDSLSGAGSLKAASGKITTPILIPGSKSHTIRALLLAGLAKGTSTIYNALDSSDTQSCIRFLRAFGITVDSAPPCIRVTSEGLDVFKHTKITEPINLENSGTTLYFATALAALNEHGVVFDGDASLRTRSASNLLNALKELGATVEAPDSACVPYKILGPIHSGEVYIECSTSQYLSALLLVLSLVEGKSVIRTKLVGEFPYIDMTLSWLAKHNIHIPHTKDYSKCKLEGGAQITPFTEHIIGDYSSAAFFMGFTAITNIQLTLKGLEPDPTQADMAFLDMLKKMGCYYKWSKARTSADDGDKASILADRGSSKSTSKSTSMLEIFGSKTPLRGASFDLANTPDLLPILAVVASYAHTPTRIYNVAHARKKETDRISVLVKELTKLGVFVEEFDDGLTIIPQFTFCALAGGTVHSYHDHRVAMALAIGACAANGSIIIKDADAVAVTFPTFFEILATLGVTIT